MPVRTASHAFGVAALVAAALALAVAPAQAADPVEDPVFTPAAPVVYDWSGVYAGLTAGASWDQFDAAFGVPPVSASFDAAGFSGGILAGINFQNGPFVFGFEADANFRTGDETTMIAGVPVTADSDWFATLRGRAGYVFDRYMIYGTGGLAVGEAEVSIPGVSTSDTKAGWTVGAGLEAALSDNFTLRGEYLYTDLGKVDGTLAGTPFSTEFDSHTVRAGVTYKFR